MSTTTLKKWGRKVFLLCRSSHFPKEKKNRFLNVLTEGTFASRDPYFFPSSIPKYVLYPGPFFISLFSHTQKHSLTDGRRREGGNLSAERGKRGGGSVTALVSTTPSTHTRVGGRRGERSMFVLRHENVGKYVWQFFFRVWYSALPLYSTSL